MVTWPILATALATLLFLAAVASALVSIVGALESIGGNGDSLLAKLRLGLRAIERETSHLPVAAPKINAGLQQIAGGLIQVDTTLGSLHAALKAQEKKA
jgi:hypothetical protein